MAASVSLFSLMGKIAVDGVEQTTKDLQDVSRTGKDTEGKLTTNFTNIANKAGELGKKAALGIAAIATAAVAAVEGTREFRQDLGKLEATFKTTNQATGAAEETFKSLFGVLGEDDTSIEAANHLAMLTNNEKDLNEWTNILTGVYATFGDSLPLEGLAEAANETMRVGQVTGPLADALNWAGVSEDAFNQKLLECTSNQEREALIRETLNGLYGEAATEYQNINGGVIENNKAQAELNLKMAEMAEKLEPLVAKGKMFLVEVLEKISPLLEWAIENMNVLAPIVLTFVGALLAMGLAGKIATFINTINTLKTAFAALNITMSVNPIFLIITAIVALIAIFVTLWNKCEWFRNFWIGLWEGIKQVAGTVWEAIKGFFSAAWDFIKGIWEGVTGFFSGIWNGIKNVFSGVGNWFKDKFTEAREKRDAAWAKTKEWASGAWNKVKEGFSGVGNWFKQQFTKAKENRDAAWAKTKEWASGAWNKVKSGFGNVGNWFKDTFTKAKNNTNSAFSNIGSIFSNIWGKIKNVFSGAGSWFSGVFNGVKNTISNVFQGVVGVVKTPINWIINGINKFIGGLNNIKIPDWVPGVGGMSLNIRMIPTLAEGGILDKGEIGLLEGNGAEAVVPLHNNKKWISKVAEDMGNVIKTSDNTEVTDKLEKLISLLSNYLPTFQNQQVVLSTGELVGALTSPLDKSLGNLAEDRRRGR